MSRAPIGARQGSESPADAFGYRRPPPRPDLDRLFDALADAERLQLLSALQLTRCTADRLAAELGWRRDEAVKQLKLLERAGLVAGVREGRRVAYRPDPAPLRSAADWLRPLVWSLRRDLRRGPLAPIDDARFVEVTAALRTQGRRCMLEGMCRGGPITQGAAAQDCGLPQGLASRGLRRLMDAGLVEIRTGRLPRRYVTVANAVAAVEQALVGRASALETVVADHERYAAAQAWRRANQHGR